MRIDQMKKMILAEIDECIIWPYGQNSKGYGQVRFDGQSRRANRVVCTIVHGDAPAGKNMVAHSCGNPPCINPRHLRWTDAHGNADDRRAHGNYAAGSDHHMARISVGVVKAIRDAHAEGNSSYQDLADRFCLSKSQVARIVKKKSWTHV